MYCRLVDSRDIVELQLKQYDCELLIRKKEALPQPPPPPPAPMNYAFSQPMSPPSSPAFQPASAPAATPAPAASLPAAKSSSSSLPPYKSPMAGTFYRCPGPGEPPFVKVSCLPLVAGLELVKIGGKRKWNPSYFPCAVWIQGNRMKCEIHQNFYQNTT